MIPNNRRTRCPVVIARLEFLCHGSAHHQKNQGARTMNINQQDTQKSITLRVAFTTREAAAYLGLAVSTLNKWRC